MSNIAEIKPVEKVCEIRHPGTEEKIGLSFTLMSLSDDRMSAVKRSLSDRNLAKRQRNKHITTAEIEGNRKELLFRAATGWNWGENEQGEQADFNGEQLEFTQKNVMLIFNTLPFVVDQLDEFLGVEKDFFSD